MKKSIICLALSLLIVGCGLGACGDPASSEKKEKQKEEYTIHYLTAKSMDEGAVKAIMKVADLYKEEHPEFQFEVESIADRKAYLQKLKILASGDRLPEMFDSDADTFFQTLVDNNQIADIDSLYEELGVTEKVFYNAREYQRLENGYLGLICWQINTEYFWYNKDIFAKAGITEVPSTFEEFFEVCEKLEESKVTPIAVAGGVTWPPLRYLAFLPFRRTGNEFIEKVCRGEEKFQSEIGLEAADFMVRVAKYFQPDWDAADNIDATKMVLEGQAAMMYDGTWQLPYFVDENKKLKENIGYFALPVIGGTDVTGPDDYWAHGGIGTAIRKDALDDQMKEFMQFVFEHYADISMFEYDTIPSIQITSTEKLSDFYKELIENYSKVETYGYCWDVKIDAASNEVLGRETRNLALGNITSEEWAARMDQAIQKNRRK